MREMIQTSSGSGMLTQTGDIRITIVRQESRSSLSRAAFSRLDFLRHRLPGKNTDATG